MACLVPFKNSDLDIWFFVFKPTVVYLDELVHALKHFSLCTQTLGCDQSAIFRSIHGNLIVWYGAWMKRENKDEIYSTLLSILSNLSNMAILLDHGVFDAYAGESIDGSQTAKFSTGDIISMKSLNVTDEDTSNLSYAVLAIFKSRFSKVDGATSGICFKCQNQPRHLNLIVFKSLQSCYNLILKVDYRKTLMPYLDKFSTDMKYDILKVDYVSGDFVPNHLNFPHNMFENGVEGEERFYESV